jgi:hypothetical protein
MTGAFDIDAERNPHRVNAHAGGDEGDTVTDRDIREQQAFRRNWIAAGQRKLWDPERRCWWTVSNSSGRGAR